MCRSSISTSPLDFWVDIATIAGPIIAFAGLGFIYWQLKSNAIESKRQRTYDLISKYYSREFFEYIYDALLFVTSLKNMNDKDRVAKIDILFNEKHNDHKHYRMRCSALFMYFEDICLMYYQNLVDKHIFEQMLGYVVPSLYKDVEDVVIGYRNEEGDQTIFEYWEKCARILNEKLEHNFKYKSNVSDGQN